MKKVQGASFGVRFYRRPAPKMSVKQPAKDTPAEKVVMQENSLIETTIPPQANQLWQSAWIPVIAKAEIAAPEQPVITKEIAALAKAAFEKAKQNRMTVENKEKLLWSAARNGDVYKIRLLVMDGADLDARDPQGRTAVNIAMQYDRKEAVKTLIAAKEMRRMAKLGDLPDSKFFKKFQKQA